MTEVTTRPPARRRPSRGRRPWIRALALAVAVLLVFLLGVALGQVTASERDPDDMPLTTVRTVVPVVADRETVTVTTTVTAAP